MNAIRNMCGHRQSGLALVETTLVLPVLAMLFIAIAEIARATMLLTTLSKAQQDGARYLSAHAFAGTTNIVSLNEASPNGNVYLARNLVVYGNIGGSGTPLLDGLTPANIVATAVPNGFVTLTTTYAFTPLFGFLNLNFPLRSSVTMRAVH